jgi:hypothetical protein
MPQELVPSRWQVHAAIIGFPWRQPQSRQDEFQWMMSFTEY